jgi:hypothetical protein
MRSKRELVDPFPRRADHMPAAVPFAQQEDLGEPIQVAAA